MFKAVVGAAVFLIGVGLAYNASKVVEETKLHRFMCYDAPGEEGYLVEFPATEVGVLYEVTNNLDCKEIGE